MLSEMRRGFLHRLKVKNIRISKIVIGKVWEGTAACPFVSIKAKMVVFRGPFSMRLLGLQWSWLLEGLKCYALDHDSTASVPIVKTFCFFKGLFRTFEGLPDGDWDLGLWEPASLGI